MRLLLAAISLALVVPRLCCAQIQLMNYSVSYEVVTNVRVGFNGYWLQQLTDNKENDIPIPHSLERTVGLGAGLQILMGRATWIHLNAYQETDVRNRAQGAA
jgi:hypothetical protein